MKQLDFSDIDVVRSADQEARHGAFWGPLGETGRAAARSSRVETMADSLREGRAPARPTARLLRSRRSATLPC